MTGSPLNEVIGAVRPGAHAASRYIQQVDLFLGAIRDPFPDGSASFDENHLKGQSGTRGTLQGLCRGHRPAEAPADNDDPRKDLGIAS
jgi:hypothetical protein